MTDKEKIRKEVERLQDLTMDKNKNFYSEAAEGEYNALCNIKHFIDSLQEEHKLKPKFQEGNKIVYVGERKELDTDEHTILYVYDDMYVTTWGKKIPFKFQDDYKLIEEPVGEELEEAAKNMLQKETK